MSMEPITVKAHAFDADGFADGRFAAEEFLAQLGAEENDAAAFGDIFRSDPATVAGDFVAHFAIFGIDATDGCIFDDVHREKRPGSERFRE